MMYDLRPYPEYKDSGLPWLGKIPTHWEVRRNGRLFAQRTETGFADLPILEVSLKTGVRVRGFEKTDRKQVMSDREKYKRALKGDIAFNMMRMWQGAVGVVPVDGLVSPAYIVARPFPEIESRYYTYLFRTAAYMNEVNQYSRGIVSDRNRLYWDEFKQMPSAFPPPKEQRKMADFLDDHDRAVRGFIWDKRRLIELLNEHKQAILNQVITRGLDPSVRLRDSGIDWLGSIPEHWQVRRLKYLAKIIYGSSPHHSTYNVDGRGTVLINGPDEYSIEEFGETRAIKWTTAPIKYAPKSALLFCLRGSTTGRLNVCHDDVSIGRGVAALVPKENELFFRYGMMALRSYLKATFRGSTFPSVTSEHLNNYRLPHLPREEQAEIVDHIEKRTNHLHSAIERTWHEIDFVQEYRNRLTSDVITGKLDVSRISCESIAPSFDLQESLNDREVPFEDELQDAEDLDLIEETADVDD